MTTEKFQGRVAVLVATLAEVHEDTIELADSLATDDAGTADQVEAAVGGLSAVMELLKLAADRCPAGGVVP